MESTKKEKISRRKLVLKFGGKYIITSLVILLFVFTLSLFDYSCRIIFLNTLQIKYIDTIISWVLFITGLIVSILVVNRMISSIFDKYKLKKTDIFALMFISFISFIICFSILKVFLYISEMNYMDYWNKESYVAILRITNYIIFFINLFILISKTLENTETSINHKEQNNKENEKNLEKIDFRKLFLKFLGEYTITSSTIILAILTGFGVGILLLPILIILLIVAQKKKIKLGFHDTLSKYIIKREDLKKLTLILIPISIVWVAIISGLMYLYALFLSSGVSEPIGYAALVIGLYFVWFIIIATIIAISLLLIIEFAKILKKTKGKEYINNEE